MFGGKYLNDNGHDKLSQFWYRVGCGADATQPPLCSFPHIYME